MRKSLAAASGPDSVTIKDIAEHLGISHSTVSRALHDHPYTNEDTKHRVRQAASKLGYVPNTAARSMRRERSSIVGLILPDIQNELFAAAAQILARYCLKAGLQLVLSISDDDAEVELRHVTALREARAAGIIITPSPGILKATKGLLSALPTVQYSRRHPDLHAPSVSLNGETAIFMATSHLLKLGHRRIAYIGANTDRSTGAERVAGYQRAFKFAKLRADTALQFLGPTHADFGYAAASRILHSDARATAVVLGNVSLMPGILRAARAADVVMPKDLSLIGFGDPSWYAEWGPGITTLGISLQSLAEAAAVQLMRQLESSGSQDVEEEHVALDATFILRGTTAAP